MSIHNCPMCYEELEVVEVTPCVDCGADEDKVRILEVDIAEKFQRDSYTYNLYRVFEDLEVIFCNYCELDIESYKSEFFGLPKGKRMSFDKLQFLECIDNPSIGKDKYCANCGYRLAFMKFVLDVRDKLKS